MRPSIAVPKYPHQSGIIAELEFGDIDRGTLIPRHSEATSRVPVPAKIQGAALFASSCNDLKQFLVTESRKA
jgi:hypothetical protein